MTNHHDSFEYSWSTRERRRSRSSKLDAAAEPHQEGPDVDVVVEIKGGIKVRSSADLACL